MNIKKEIKVFEDKSFSVSYTEETFEITDSKIAVYDRYKISILLSDGLAAVCGDSVINSGRGSVLFFRPDEIHFGRFFRSGLHRYLDFYIPLSFFESSIFKSEVGDFLKDRSEDRVNCIVFSSEERRMFSEISKEVVELLTNGGKNTDLKIFSALLRVLLLCSEFYEGQNKRKSEAEPPKIVSETMLYISENFENDISLSSLSEAAKCSVTYLMREFKRYTGMTVWGYVTAVRIANSQKILKEGGTVTEACFSSGFSDCSNFIEKFKKSTGITPLKYKKEFS